MDTGSCNCDNCPAKKQVQVLLTYLQLNKAYVEKLEKYKKKLEELNSMMDLQFEEVEKAVDDL